MPTAADLREAVGMVTAKPVVAISRLIGEANETHAVDLEDGQRLVVRILRFSTPDRARREVAVQQALTAAGVVVPVHLPLGNGEVVGSVAGLHFTVSEFIDGHHPPAITRALAADFGRVLATFHQATKGLTVHGRGWMNPAEVRAAVAAVRDPDFRASLEQLQATTVDVFDPGLPHAVIHGDVWPGNVFTDGDRVTAVLDLETVEYAPRIVDVGRTAVGLVAASTRKAAEVLDVVTEAYESVHPLTLDERTLLPLAYRHAAIASAAWNIENGYHGPAHAALAEARHTPA